MLLLEEWIIALEENEVNNVKTVMVIIIKTVIWSVLLYGAETWSLRKEDVRRLEAFEMWIWRRIEKISYTEHITNEEVLNRVRETRVLIETILRK